MIANPGGQAFGAEVADQNPQLESTESTAELDAVLRVRTAVMGDAEILLII